MDIPTYFFIYKSTYSFNLLWNIDYKELIHNIKATATLKTLIHKLQTLWLQHLDIYDEIDKMKKY